MYDIIIIGSGPAGYVSAIRAGQLGLKTAIIEKGKIGGMCLNWGCIPSKAIIESAKLYQKITKDASRFGIDGIEKGSLSFNWNKAVKRSDGIVKKLTGGVEYLLKKNGVDIITGQAKIISENSVLSDNRLLEAKNIIIATGSSSVSLESGGDLLVLEPVNLFVEREIPDNVVVFGNSPVAIEIAQAFSMINKKVTIISPTDGIMPKADSYISKYILTTLQKEKIKVIFNQNITSVKDKWSGGILKTGESDIKCDVLINAGKRKGNIIESDIDIKVSDSFIVTDEHFETSVPGIYAIGDVNGMSSYANSASAQGLYVINKINGIENTLDLKKVPVNMYTVPEAAQIGLTESEIKELNIDYKSSEFPLSANGKAQTEGNSEGFIRILSEKQYGEVLGVQIVASNATDMINEASAYMQLESTVYDVANTIHTHPAVSEVFMEVGAEALDRAIHK